MTLTVQWCVFYNASCFYWCWLSTFGYPPRPVIVFFICLDYI